MKMASGSLALLLLILLQTQDLVVAEDVFALQPDTGSTERGDVCKECTQIFELVADLISSKDLQNKLLGVLEGLCEHLPGPKGTAEICKQQVEKMLPFAIHFVAGAIKPAELCKALGLCSASDEQRKMLLYFVNEALEAAAANESKNTCSFCLFLMKTLEGLLPKKRTEDAVTHLLEDLCHVLPAHQQQCTELVDKFSKVIIDAVLSYATPRSICELLRLCKSQDAAARDLCTLEAYRCRDVTAALRCGTLFYCQRFAWKSVNNREALKVTQTGFTEE